MGAPVDRTLVPNASVAQELARARRLCGLLVGICLGLVGALFFVWRAGSATDPERLVELALASPEVRQAAIAELVEGGEGLHDSFPDPEVGRVLQPNLERRDMRGVAVSTNAFGLREDPFEWDKPEGTVRVVLLGDSYVFGHRVEQEERVGVLLRQALVERSRADLAIEVLHFAIPSWNIVSETSYLRRQISRLRPDLIFHVVIANDLDDAKGVRGFGALANFSPQVRARATGLMAALTPRGMWSRRLPNFFHFALDWESQRRYAECAAAIEDLVSAAEGVGARYVLVGGWQSFNPLVKKYLGRDLEEAQMTFLPTAFATDERYRLEPSDRHWTPKGHRRVAELFYGLIVERDLLASLELEAWESAERAVVEIDGAGRFEAEQIEGLRGLAARKGARSDRCFDRLEPAHQGGCEAGARWHRR